MRWEDWYFIVVRILCLIEPREIKVRPEVIELPGTLGLQLFKNQAFDST